MAELVATDTIDRVRYLTLDRPEKRNAINRALLDQLFAAVEAARRDDGVGSLVIRGAGPSFCSGVDVSPEETDMDFAARPLREEIDHLNDAYGRFQQLWTLTKPVIASVHGHCLAMGTDLAFHCDVVLCSEDARFGYPMVRTTGSPTTHMWTYLAGPQWAKRMLLTGDTIDGRMAERAGFVLLALPADELAQATHEMAAKMAKVPYGIAAQNKAICNRALELMGRSTLQELARESDAIAHRAPEAQEFGRIARERGVRAALSWQRDRFEKG